MLKAEDQELLTYIQQIAQATRAQQIEWTRANPTTFTWSIGTSQQAPRVSLQKVEKSQVVRDPASGRAVVSSVRQFVFQAMRGAAGLPVLSVTSSENDEIGQELGGLFEAVSGTAARKGLDFLRSIIPSPPNKTPDH